MTQKKSLARRKACQQGTRVSTVEGTRATRVLRGDNPAQLLLSSLHLGCSQCGSALLLHRLLRAGDLVGQVGREVASRGMESTLSRLWKVVRVDEEDVTLTSLALPRSHLPTDRRELQVTQAQNVVVFGTVAKADDLTISGSADPLLSGEHVVFAAVRPRPESRLRRQWVLKGPAFHRRYQKLCKTYAFGQRRAEGNGFVGPLGTGPMQGHKRCIVELVSTKLGRGVGPRLLVERVTTEIRESVEDLLGLFPCYCEAYRQQVAHIRGESHCLGNAEAPPTTTLGINLQTRSSHRHANDSPCALQAAMTFTSSASLGPLAEQEGLLVEFNQFALHVHSLPKSSAPSGFVMNGWGVRHAAMVPSGLSRESWIFYSNPVALGLNKETKHCRRPGCGCVFSGDGRAHV
jgi:hypothetical protein